MTSWDEHDADLQCLTRLSRLTPDASRGERVRARCLGRLERSRRLTECRAAMAGSTRRVLAPAVVSGVTVLYVAALVATALGLEDMFR